MLEKTQVKTVSLPRGIVADAIYRIDIPHTCSGCCARCETLKCFRQALAATSAPAEPSTNLQTWPSKIWLSHSEDGYPTPVYQVETDEISWCESQQRDCDIEYVRADLAASSQPVAPAIPSANGAGECAIEALTNMGYTFVPLAGWISPCDAVTQQSLPAQTLLQQALDAMISMQTEAAEHGWLKIADDVIIALKIAMSQPVAPEVPGTGNSWMTTVRHKLDQGYPGLSHDESLKLQELLLSIESAAPTQQREDSQLIDWLETMVVNVREPLLYGSRDLFWAGPCADDPTDTDPAPSNIRSQIRAAIAALPREQP